jgi:hypothetical protein
MIVLELKDPLAEALGALPPGGTFRYTYEDAVKLSGHSCPTVAGAFLMTAVALKKLYPDSIPERGQIEVTVGGVPNDGSAGPMAQVIALITGAAPETGFRGLMGRWNRNDLLKFDAKLKGRIRFKRRDSGASVELEYNPSPVASHPDLGKLLPLVLTGRASAEDRRRFAELWQARVSEILSGDPSRVVRTSSSP